MNDLYQEDAVTVFRLYDPVAKKYCRSGRGLYAKNGRSVWFSKGAATNARNALPKEIRDRVEVKEFILSEVQHEGN